MIRLSYKTREHLRASWPAINTAVATLGQLIGIEVGEMVARMVPTNIADNWARNRVKAEADRRIQDAQAWLKQERDRD